MRKGQDGMTDELHRALAECLEAKERGPAALKEAIRRYSQHRGELERLLRLHSELDKALLVWPSPAFLRGARQRPLDQLEPRVAPIVTHAHPIRISSSGNLHPTQTRRRTMRWALTLVLLTVLFGVSGIAYASADTLPGDWLYPVKTSIEGLRLALSPTEVGDARIQLLTLRTRLEELQRLVALGREEQAFEALASYWSQLKQVSASLADLVDDSKRKSEWLRSLESQWQCWPQELHAHRPSSALPLCQPGQLPVLLPEPGSALPPSSTPTATGFAWQSATPTDGIPDVWTRTPSGTPYGGADHTPSSTAHAGPSLTPTPTGEATHTPSGTPSGGLDATPTPEVPDEWTATPTPPGGPTRTPTHTPAGPYTPTPTGVGTPTANPPPTP